MNHLIITALSIYAAGAYATLVAFELLPDLTRISISDSDRNIAIALSAVWPLPVLVLSVAALIRVVDWSIGQVKRAWRCGK